MALEEVVRYLGPHNEIPLTLTRDSETGHFLLKHFLPILQQYHDTGNINETNPIVSPLMRKEINYWHIMELL